MVAKRPHEDASEGSTAADSAATEKLPKKLKTSQDECKAESGQAKADSVSSGIEDDEEKKRFLRKRNAVYSKKNYYRKKSEFKDLENWSFELRAVNFDLKQEQKRLQNLLTAAQEHVLVRERAELNLFSRLGSGTEVIPGSRYRQLLLATALKNGAPQPSQRIPESSLREALSHNLPAPRSDLLARQSLTARIRERSLLTEARLGDPMASKMDTSSLSADLSANSLLNAAGAHGVRGDLLNKAGLADSLERERQHATLLMRERLFEERALRDARDKALLASMNSSSASDELASLRNSLIAKEQGRHAPRDQFARLPAGASTASNDFDRSLLLLEMQRRQGRLHI